MFQIRDAFYPQSTSLVQVATFQGLKPYVASGCIWAGLECWGPFPAMSPGRWTCRHDMCSSAASLDCLHLQSAHGHMCLLSSPSSPLGSVSFLNTPPDQAGMASSPRRHILILPVLTRVIFRGHLPCHPPWGRLCFPRMAVTHPHPSALFVIWRGHSFSGVVGSVCPLESGLALMAGQKVETLEMTYVAAEVRA